MESWVVELNVLFAAWISIPHILANLSGVNFSLVVYLREDILVSWLFTNSWSDVMPCILYDISKSFSKYEYELGSSPLKISWGSHSTSSDVSVILGSHSMSL